MMRKCKLCREVRDELYQVPIRLSPNEPEPNGEMCRPCLEAAGVVLLALQAREKSEKAECER